MCVFVSDSLALNSPTFPPLSSFSPFAVCMCVCIIHFMGIMVKRCRRGYRDLPRFILTFSFHLPSKTKILAPPPFLFGLVCLAPRVIQHLFYCISLANISVQHTADQVDAVLAEYKRDAKVSIHNLINAVEGVLFVDDGI